MKSIVLLFVFLCCSIFIEAEAKTKMRGGVGGCMYYCMTFGEISEDQCWIECKDNMPVKKRSVEELPLAETLKKENEKDVKKQE